MPIEPDRLYHELGYLIAEMPDLAAPQWQTAEAHRWLGRASAWIEQSGNLVDGAAFNAAVNSLCPNPRFPSHIGAAWSLGQSFNALAARAPTSLIRAVLETAQLKIQAHNLIWQTSAPI